MIQVDNVTKKYGRHVVVDDVSLELPKGEVIAMIGPNGAGKSTLLGLISRTLKSDGGSVQISGIDLKEWDTNALAKEMGILKQSAHISVRITVYDLVCFGRFPYNKGKLTKEDKAKVEEAITYMDLEGIRHRYIDELSGGQRQRAYIGAIYAQDTDYILLDEPLNNLDIKYAATMLRRLRHMAKEKGKSIIIVIHDINFAAAYADRMVMMKEGVIAASGTVTEMMDAELLEAIYEMPFDIIDVHGKKLCAYY